MSLVLPPMNIEKKIIIIPSGPIMHIGLLVINLTYSKKLYPKDSKFK